LPKTLPKFVATFAIAGSMVVALAACSPTEPEATDNPASEIDYCATPSGDASDAVTVTGDIGSAPEVEFDGGLTVSETERTLVIEGDGDELPFKGTANVAYSAYNGETGELFETYGYGEEGPIAFTADPSTLLPGLVKSISCVAEGSRVVSVIPPSEGFGEEGLETEGFTINGEDSLVFVIDVIEIKPDKAWGEDQPEEPGFPTVQLEEDGTPNVTVPKGDPPSDLQIAVLKLGDGETVPEGATVRVQYQGLDWATGEIFDQSWGRGAATFSLAQVVPGFSQAIAGQTVGSQVIAVIPPELAYGEDPDAHELAGKTLVFVIDILEVVG
jgi:FKBP-type peptidyl-prolyl cis-trans isomerase